MVSNDILVSVIVPVYGTEAYLPACIESICNQSYTNLQIILVDDQSPDRCPEICDSYAGADSRVLVIHQRNMGVSAARNAGLKYASGDYIMFVDSDDELCPDAVRLLLDDAIAFNADVTSGLQTIMAPKGAISSTHSGGCELFHHEQPMLLSLAGDENTVSACAKLYKANLIADIYFEEGRNINEDGYFVFLCYIRKPKLVQRNVTVYQYNFHQDSSSHQKFSDKYLSMLYFCERKKQLISEHYPQYKEQAYNMEVRTNLQMLDLLCSTTDRQYKPLEKQCVRTVRDLYAYHRPINDHHSKLAWIVAHGFYPVYKFVIRMKYYR